VPHLLITKTTNYSETNANNSLSISLIDSLKPDNMTSPSDDSTSASALNLSRLIFDLKAFERISETFLPDALHTAVLRYYHHISRTIKRLENELEIQRYGQHAIFDHLLARPTLPILTRPIIRDYKGRTNHMRHHPYCRTPSPHYDDQERGLKRSPTMEMKEDEDENGEGDGEGRQYPFQTSKNPSP
jgi:hypothetical protein